MGKEYYKFLGVNKAATAGGRSGKHLSGAGGKGKGIGGIPLTGKDCQKSLGVNNPAWANAGGGDGGLPGGGAGGRDLGSAPTLFPTDHSTFKTAVSVMNQYYEEEEDCGAFEDVCSTFTSTVPSTFFKTAVKVTNECFHEEENCGLPEDGDKENSEDATKLLADEDNDGAVVSDGGSEDGGDGDYDDYGIGDIDDFLNGDNYYYDVAAAGFDFDL